MESEIFFFISEHTILHRDKISYKTQNTMVQQQQSMTCKIQFCKLYFARNFVRCNGMLYLYYLLFILYYYLFYILLIQ